ncbi:MAG: 50S ribosomal protein L11 [DPANN group archaeon]|nr:50S ribosomal protein L11 [DPANN group archaeon]
MAKEKIEVLIQGGKATAAPPLGPALGPMGVNIGQVVSEINKKTASFQGMQVPVKVLIDSETKAFEIEIGTPPASSLIIKEAGIKKGASNPLTDKVADLKIEQIIKIAKMKEDSLLGKTLKEKVKEIVGTCQSMGILVEGTPALETIGRINEGTFDEAIRLEKTELSAEELKTLDEEKKRLAEELEKRREEFTNIAKQTLSEMKGKPSSAIKHKLQELKIPEQVIKEILPEDEAEKPAAGAPEKKEEKK